MARGRNKREAGSAGEASKQSQREAKTTAALKPEPKIAKRSPNQNLNKSKESKTSAEVQGKQEKKNNENRKKEKDIANKENGNAQAKDQRDQNHKEKLGGMIFMCSRNTKPDCFRYMVMGLPEGKRELVMTIKPGIKLFLYDFDAKLLYGVYKASSPGGMRLEPSAFQGSYPAQVRFKIHMDCTPLPDEVFKKAIKENYDGKKNFFKTELTVQQVKKLVELFRPAPQLQSNVLTAPSPRPLPVPLAPPRPIMPAVEAPLYPHPEILPRGPYAPDDARRYYYAPVYKDTASTRREAVPLDPLSLSEKEYRTHGLKPPAPASVPAPETSHGSRDPDYPHRAVPDRYALAPRRASYPSELDYQPDLYRRRAEETEHNIRPVAEQSSNQATYHLPHSYGTSRRVGVEYGGRADEGGRLHSAHAANALADYYNQRYQLPGSRADPGSLPVSSRYSFAGPDLSYR